MNDNTLDNFFSALLFRVDCPDTMLLGDFHRGLLDDDNEAEEIRNHLLKCHHCVEEIGRLDVMLAEVPEKQPSFVWQRLDELGQLVIRFLRPSPVAPQLVAVKGASTDLLREATLLPEETGGVDVAVSVFPTTETKCNVNVRVQIPERWPDLSGVMVTLVADEVPVEKVTDENGDALFNDISRSSLDSLTLNIHL